MKELIQIRHDLLEAIELGDTLLAKCYVNKLDSWIYHNSKSINLLAEPFTGTLPQIKEHFLRKWAKQYVSSDEKWEYISISLLDDIMVKNQETGELYTLWAGTSGTNDMLIGRTGGCHQYSSFKDTKFDVVC